MAAKPKRKTRRVRPVAAHPNRPTHVALVLASLVAGIFVLFNLDRTLHQAESNQLSYNASQHGWPMVYLIREFDPELPNYARWLRSNDWPWPAVKGEVRTWDSSALLTDLIVGLLVVGGSFMLVRESMQRLSNQQDR